MNKQKLANKQKYKKKRLLVNIKYDEDGVLMDPYASWGYLVRNNIFYRPDCYPEYQFMFNPPKERIFNDITPAYKWIERNYGHWAASHFLKNLELYC